MSLNSATRAAILDDAERRIRQILQETLLRIDQVMDEVEDATGVRPGPAPSVRSSILDDSWGRLLHHREQCLHLLNAIDELEPLMGPGAGVRRAVSVEAALKTAPADVAARVFEWLAGAGLVALEEEEIPLPE